MQVVKLTAHNAQRNMDSTYLSILSNIPDNSSF